MEAVQNVADDTSQIDKLKAEEKYNREFYNNIQEKSSNSLFDNFFDRGSEKDW